MSGENENGRFREAPSQVFNRTDAPASRNGEVERENIGVLVAREGVIQIECMSVDAELAFSAENAFEPVFANRLVVD